MMKNKFKRFSSFAKSRDKSPSLQNPDLTTSQRLRESVYITKTIIKKKIGVIPDVDGIPQEFEDYKSNLKSLYHLFDELSKHNNFMVSNTEEEIQAGKKIASALSAFTTHLGKTEASRALGELIKEYSKIQNTVEDLRNSSFTEMWLQSRNESDSYIVGLQSTKQLYEQVSKAHYGLLNAISEITQLIGETHFIKSISDENSDIDNILQPIDEKIDHMAVYKAYLKYYKKKKSYHTKLDNAKNEFENNFIQKEINVVSQIDSYYTAQRSFHYGAYSKFEQLSQKFNIQEAFENSETIHKKNVKIKEERELRDSKRSQENKWVSLLEFFNSVGKNILCLAKDQNEEQRLLEMILRAFNAYNMAVPWLKKLITAEVSQTNEPSTLLRGNIFITKLLLAFMRITCGDILFLPLREFAQDMINQPEKYELDPQKITESQSLQENITNIISQITRLLNIITGSIEVYPLHLKVILCHLREETDNKFPGKGTTFAGAYMFLRFLCPALVFPEQNGILPTECSVSKEQRRSLMLVSKSLQNLANGVDFREDYMEQMNDVFLKPNKPIIREFFSTISHIPDDNKEVDLTNTLIEVNQRELPFLYQLVFSNMSVLAKQLEDEGEMDKVIDLATTLGRLSATT